ncbi:MAG TPA: RNase adapter RapZ [Caldisericia bacterium]|nr:RNase adapter RapZ [Caldisericia bacterium]HPF48976.1 RNase adapter RapZ [Caldisericia bacterium]HPI83160.1 RNase adapter RapZ [Caldisericia bacterium]HPQ92387.1 RNase adapter RapZ [Caldisericia bacterium]HRV74515.1 RNase adapter RapZ [Caldisericia bacterium]
MKRTLVIISGQSGAGKSKALGALEDLGFFTVENLPLELVSKFVGLGDDAPDRMKQMAITVRLTSDTYSELLEGELNRLKAGNIKTEIIFLEANTDTLIRRFQETRRNHPLIEESGSIFDAIQKEKLILKNIKQLATHVIDTSSLTVNDLRVRIKKYFSKTSTNNGLRITLISFGFRNGIPTDADLVMDVRFINNPHYVEELRDKDGTTKEVFDYVMSDDSAKRFIDEFSELLKFLLPQYLAREGKSMLTVAFGCTGGRHRSVAVTEEIARILRSMNYSVNIVHRDKDVQ